MSLSDSEILIELGKNIDIFPFVKENLGSNSYDVTLGPYFYRSTPNKKVSEYLNDTEEKSSKRNKTTTTVSFVSTENGSQIAEYWNATAGANMAETITDPDLCKQLGITSGDAVILLSPGELILGHTHEVVGTREYYTTIIQSRSTSGRIGLSICKDSNFGSIGYMNKWTLEIENHSTRTIILKVNQKIAQIGFYRTGPVTNNYSKIGQYNNGTDVQKIFESWIPTSMLPKIAVKWLEQQAAATLKAKQYMNRNKNLEKYLNSKIEKYIKIVAKAISEAIINKKLEIYLDLEISTYNLQNLIDYIKFQRPNYYSFQFFKKTTIINEGYHDDLSYNLCINWNVNTHDPNFLAIGENPTWYKEWLQYVQMDI
jgi:dCTP deaminase